MQNIIIDEEFRDLIPPLTEEEREQLETNLLGDGVRDPLVTWNGILIDGHNRYEIAQKYGLDFKVVEMEFGSRDEAKIWVVYNQLGRRNLSDWARTKASLKLKPAIQGKTPDARGDIAELAGVSTNTVHRVGYLMEHADEETLEALDNGEISINKAFTETKPKETYTDIKGTAVERKDAILERLPHRESTIGLPYQDIATKCIKDIRDNDLDSALDGVMKLLENPTPVTMALAKVILRAI